MEDLSFWLLVACQALAVVFLLCVALLILMLGLKKRLKKAHSRMQPLKQALEKQTQKTALVEAQVENLSKELKALHGHLDACKEAEVENEAASVEQPDDEGLEQADIAAMEREELLELVEQYKSRFQNLKMFEDQYYALEHKYADLSQQLDDLRFEKQGKPAVG